MQYLYERNVCAFFLGDGKKTRKRARQLYRTLRIRSFVFDEHPSLLSRLCPFLSASSYPSGCDDSILLDLIDSAIEKSGRSVLLLIIGNADSRRLVERNGRFFQSRFISDESLISEMIQ